jgi:hypothetical protein
MLKIGKVLSLQIPASLRVVIIQIKQRLTALLLRSERLIKGTPENKISVKSKLTTNRSRLQQEMALNKVLTSQVEEEIVRKGCPGINL